MTNNIYSRSFFINFINNSQLFLLDLHILLCGLSYRVQNLMYSFTCMTFYLNLVIISFIISWLWSLLSSSTIFGHTYTFLIILSISSIILTTPITHYSLPALQGGTLNSDWMYIVFSFMMYPQISFYNTSKEILYL